ncbi:PD-(D/E)XK nuclease family protein [Candidatus Woesearchaeota archaeon]|nr:PD-(D/E)XK nuclease family protein [Candidatus Woesearchaeota archaeon]
MTIYSHSRLSTFEQCPLKFKYNYIDQIKTEIEQTIEAFMGEMVHKSLEKIYVDLKFRKLNSLQELMDYFNDLWKKNYNESILIVRKEYSAENYRQMGEKFISDYYEKHTPFNQSITLDTEKRIVINLDKEGKYVLQGYIDRLACKGTVYEIHDYKTSSSLPLQEYADADRQLALYSIAVKQGYPDAADIKLIWHYLAFNKEIISKRSEEELENLKKETIELIKQIEACKEFEPKTSALCDWCEFRGICPKWKHLAVTENLPVNEYLNEDGVKLANKYVEFNKKKTDIEDEMSKIREALFDYCKKNHIEVVFGSDNKLVCKTYENFKFPGKNELLRKHLEEALKKLGRYDEVAELDVFKLSRILKSREWPENIREILMNFARDEKVQRIYIGKKY